MSILFSPLLSAHSIANQSVSTLSTVERKVELQSSVAQQDSEAGRLEGREAEVLVTCA